MFEGATAQQLFDMVQRVYDGQAHINERMEHGQDRFEAQSVMLAEIKSDVSYLKCADQKRAAHIDKLHDRIAALEVSENKREGLDGFLSLFLRSPAIAWLAALCAAAWAFLVRMGEGLAK